MPALSVVIITFNEERNIARCLESVRPVADEIVVVDSFSTDRTPELCRGFAVNFMQREWEGYSGAKNYGNSRARNDFVLSIDADEALSPELIASVAAAKKAPAAGTYSFSRRTNYCGRWILHGGWYPDVKIRLFDRTRARWEGEIHEHLAGVEPGNVERLSGDCLHYSYASRDGHLAQTRHFSAISARALFDAGKKSSLSKRLFSPPIKFARDYLLRAGFLDGRAGFSIAAISAWATYLKYAHLHNLQKGKSKKEPAA